MKYNFLLLIPFIFGVSNVARAQMGKIDTSHISDESFCVVRLDVKRILAHTKDPEKILKRFAEEMKKDMGLDFFSVNCITLQFGDTDIWPGAPSFAMTMEFAKDIDRDSVREFIADRARYREVTQNGKKYLKPESERDPHFYFQGKRKFTMATPSALKAILFSGSGMGKMTSRIKSAPPGSEILAAFQKTEKFEDSIGKYSRELSAFQSVLDLEQLMGKTRSGFAFMNLTSGNPIRIQLTVDSDQSGQSLKTDLDSLMTLGKASVPAAKAFLEMQIEKLEDAGQGGNLDVLPVAGRLALGVGVDSLNASEKILAAAVVKNTGNRVLIEVKQMGGFKELAGLAVKGLAMMLGLEAVPPGEAE